MVIVNLLIAFEANNKSYLSNAIIKYGLEFLLIFKANSSFEAINSFFNIRGFIKTFTIKTNNIKCCFGSRVINYKIFPRSLLGSMKTQVQRLHLMWAMDWKRQNVNKVYAKVMWFSWLSRTSKIGSES